MKKWFSIGISCIIVTLISCHPEPDAQRLIDELAVATNYDPSTNFGSFNTFAIPVDTIGFISNTTNDTLLTASESPFPRPVLSEIQSNLSQRGYVLVEKNNNPDLGVNVFVVNDLDIFQSVGYYPGNYYSGYYGYSSWYYPYTQTYLYNTGVLVIEIVDLKNKTPDNKVKVIWNAYLGDVYSTLDLIPQTVKAIDQAFVQSPYLTK